MTELQHHITTVDREPTRHKSLAHTLQDMLDDGKLLTELENLLRNAFPISWDGTATPEAGTLISSRIVMFVAELVFRLDPGPRGQKFWSKIMETVRQQVHYAGGSVSTMTFWIRMVFEMRSIADGLGSLTEISETGPAILLFTGTMNLNRTESEAFTILRTMLETTLRDKVRLDVFNSYGVQTESATSSDWLDDDRQLFHPSNVTAAMDVILGHLEQSYMLLKSYHLYDFVIVQAFDHMLVYLDTIMFNGLIMLDRYLNESTALQIAINVHRIVMWCEDHELTEANIRLVHVKHAAQLAQHVGDPELGWPMLRNICWSLTEDQINSLMCQCHPISPASRSCHGDSYLQDIDDQLFLKSDCTHNMRYIPPVSAMPTSVHVKLPIRLFHNSVEAIH